MNISFDDFQKLDLRVGKILSAERVEGSEKLIKLQISLGEEERQIIAGIGTSYIPEDLIEKEVVVVANLESRKLMGIESQGMLLATRNEEGVVILMPQKEVLPGSKIS